MQSKIPPQACKQNLKSKIDWFLLAFLIFIPRLLNLDVFLTADETLLLEYAREFAAGLSSGDLSRTLGIGHPGVTVAWLGAPVVGLFPTELGAYTAGRVVTALATGLLLLVLYGLARRLLGRWPALFGLGLLALDPYTLAYSRLFHIAAPLTMFMTLAGLAWLLCLRDGGQRWLFLAGVFTGLAWLTKSTALILGPLLGVIVLGQAIISGQWSGGRWWLSKLAGLLVVVLVAVILFFALWPAMWSQPAQAIQITFDRLLTDKEAGAGNLGLFWLGRFVEDPGPAFYPVAFLLKATPWLLVGLLLSLWQIGSSLKHHLSNCKISAPRATSQSPQHRANVSHLYSPISLWLFALTYLIIMTIASKKSIRYMLPAFPTFYLLVGLAFYQVLEGWKDFWLRNPSFVTRKGWKVGRLEGRKFVSSIFQSSNPSILPRINLPIFQSSKWLLAILFILSILLLPFYHPYYFTYYNPLLLGWRWAPRTLLVGWGEGLDQAAAYLNQQPPTTVTAWYEWLFPIFYKGQVEAVVPQENLITADYTTLYINQVQRDIPSPNIIHYFRTRRRPAYTVHLAGIDYAWVYPGPIARLDRPDPSPQYPLGGDFGDETHLLGYDLHPQPRSGEPLIVTLYWRVLARPAADRFVYLRLVDAQGHIWAKADSPPVMGLWPVERWQPGMLIEDAQEVSIPAGTPPGTYRLELGLYEPATGQVLPAGGQPIGQGGGLLLGDIQVEWQSRQVEPDLTQQTDVRLAPNARLVGYTMPLTAATTGDVLPVELAWREAATLVAWISKPNNNLVMFEWRTGATGQPLAEQLDTLPLPIDHWGRKALLRSQHDVITPPTLATGVYELWVMLHDGSNPAGEPFLLGAVEVTAPAHKFTLPAGAIATAHARLGESVALAGYNFQWTNPTLDLNLYWQTDAPITTSYKVFAQLLDAGNNLVAQADAVPATGQHPTTGWLPGEIITDRHTLTLPADFSPGTYRLIAGLYDPLTGERLPRLDGEGDAILVTEVTLP